MYFHCCENRDSNSSAVSLQGFSKEAPSGDGMDSLIEHKGSLWDPVEEFFVSNHQNSKSRYYTLTSTNSLSLMRVSNSGKGSDRSVSFMGSALAPEQLASP